MRIKIDKPCRTYRVDTTDMPTETYTKTMQFSNEATIDNINAIIVKETLENIRYKKYKAYPEADVTVVRINAHRLKAVCKIKYAM